MTTPDVWSDEQVSAYVEACRVVPAIMAARTRGAVSDAQLLLREYHELCEQLPLIRCDAWTCLFTAALHWFSNTAKVLSSVTEEPLEEMYQEMSATAALWEASRA